MSDSYQRKPHRDDQRQDPADQHTRSGPPTSFIFSALLGFTLGFFIAGAVVVILRGFESETDGMNTLYQALAVLGPAILALLVAIVIRKKAKTRGRFSKQIAIACIVVGLASGAALLVTSPTQRAIAKKLMEDNREMFVARAGQLAACRAQLDDYPPGSLGEKITADQLAELQSVGMNLNRSRYRVSEGWNTILAADTDFVRLKPGTNPDDIMTAYDRPKPQFRSPDTYAYSSEFNEDIDELAEALYGNPYLSRRDAEELVETFKPLRYLVIVRAADINPPVLTGEQFIPGFFSGEAFCFELEQKRLIAAFPFAATNSEHVQYTYEKNSSVTAVADSAMQSLMQDLVISAWPAFWLKLHELAGAAVSPNKQLDLPFKPVALGEAKLIWAQKRAKDAEREKRVNEALEGLESGSAEAPARLNAEQEAEIRKLLAEKGKIPAIKRIREITGLGLADSKAIVDGFIAAEMSHDTGREVFALPRRGGVTPSPASPPVPRPPAANTPPNQ